VQNAGYYCSTAYGPPLVKNQRFSHTLSKGQTGGKFSGVSQNKTWRTKYKITVQKLKGVANHGNPPSVGGEPWVKKEPSLAL
jgi:hypothetical protein